MVRLQQCLGWLFMFAIRLNLPAVWCHPVQINTDVSKLPCHFCWKERLGRAGGRYFQNDVKKIYLKVAYDMNNIVR